MIFLILLLPLISAIFAGIFGNYVGRIGSVQITIFCMFVVTFFSIFFLFKTSLINEVFFLSNGAWISSGLFLVNWGVLFDSVTISMLSMISIVSTVVHVYSGAYMFDDPHLSRFMSYLSLFTFFMFVLITSDNFIQLFLGWEGVGLCSYLLINFWFNRIQANKSALKALIINRIGDFGFIIGILIIFLFFRSVDFEIIFILSPYFCHEIFTFWGYNLQVLSWITLFLFIGSIGKSAQFGLHIWLPDAMEGPTPVSALIHAATMVTAGVFLIIRCSGLFEYVTNILFFITIVGSLTAFFASTVGLAQNDLKKVIAYSTASQLGYMIFSCGISAYNVGFFHLINHAFFKALLFLGSGVIIHGLNNEQDMRKMGNLIKLFPITYSFIFIGSLSLGGFPFLSGFYSKDVILELAFSKYQHQGLFAFIFGSLSAFFTSFYSSRLLFLTFGQQNNNFRYNVLKINEGNSQLVLPLIFLVIGSIFSGYFLKDMFLGFGSIFFSSSIVNISSRLIFFDMEFIPLSIKILPTIFGFFGFSVVFFIYNTLKFNRINKINLWFYSFLNNKWYFDHIYNYYIGYFLLALSFNICYKTIDKGFLEYFGASKSSNIIFQMSRFNLYFETGILYNYLFLIIFSWLLLLFIFEILFQY